MTDGSGEEEDGVGRFHVDWDSLPWFGSSGPAGKRRGLTGIQDHRQGADRLIDRLIGPTGPLLPLRANRSVFLPLWNNVDYSGEAWREAPPTEEEEEDEEEEEEEEGRNSLCCLFSR